jgi:hypothetical protein
MGFLALGILGAAYITAIICLTIIACSINKEYGK